MCPLSLVWDFLLPTFASQKPVLQEKNLFLRVHASPHSLNRCGSQHCKCAHTSFCSSTNHTHTLIWPATCVVSVLTDFPEKLALFRIWSYQRGGTKCTICENCFPVPSVCAEPLEQEELAHRVIPNPGHPDCPRQDTFLNTALSFNEEKMRSHSVHQPGTQSQQNETFSSIKTALADIIDIFLFT